MLEIKKNSKSVQVQLQDIIKKTESAEKLTKEIKGKLFSDSECMAEAFATKNLDSIMETYNNMIWRFDILSDCLKNIKTELNDIKKETLPYKKTAENATEILFAVISSATSTGTVSSKKLSALLEILNSSFEQFGQIAMQSKEVRTI